MPYVQNSLKEVIASSPGSSGEMGLIFRFFHDVPLLPRVREEDDSGVLVGERRVDQA